MAINKKGFTASGFGIIVGLILLLLSGSIILVAVKNQASKVDEKLQVDLCRISNEIKFGLKEKTSNIVSGPQICSTIDKTEGKMQVPNGKYPQNSKGAEAEIRDMIKSCWHMWLDGSQKNTFEKYPFSEGCFTCYTFRVSKDASSVTFKSLSDSMSEPYFAADKSDQCAPYGGFWRTACSNDEKELSSKKISPGANYKCCVRDLRDECGNKGGICSDSGSPSGYPRIYNEWSCPGRGQTCYVRDDSVYSFTRYIREYGSRGGDIFFMSPGGQEASDMNFVPGERYAISFLSPSSQFCTKEGGIVTNTGCYAAIGGYAIGTAAGVVVLYFVGAPAAAAGGTILKFLGLGTIGGVAGTAVVANEFGIIDRLLKSGAEFVTSGITIDVPNFMLVSTEHDARQLGCTIQYSGQS
ncbi:hypothetical protein HYU09_03250 [Candidatus Woesearchaeota archaeon]|nr:hypothetical protein [Candidatus Woesearchaeota archaeon]